jgi:hypothetical protein
MCILIILMAKVFGKFYDKAIFGSVVLRWMKKGLRPAFTGSHLLAGEMK